MIDRKRVNALKKDLHGMFDINVLPRNYIKQVKINSSKFEYGLDEKTRTVDFDFQDESTSGYPGTNPNRNEQPITLSGTDPAVFVEGINPLPPYPAIFFDSYKLYYNVKVILKLNDLCFPKTALSSVFNSLEVKLNYTEDSSIYGYTYTPTTYTRKRLSQSSEAKTTIKTISTINTDTTFYSFSHLEVRCANYELINDEIHLKLFIQWEASKYTIDEIYENFPSKATLTTLTLDSLSIVLKGDCYKENDHSYIFGVENTKYIFERNNKLLNNYTVINNSLLEDSNPYSTKIFNNYQMGKIYGKTISTYGEFKNKNGDIILNGLSGRMLEPYDVIYFPEYEMIENKKFVITGIEFSNENSELQVEFKEYIGSDNFTQEVDPPILYIAPTTNLLPITPPLNTFACKAFSINEQQINKVQLKVDPDIVVEGDYLLRTPDTHPEGKYGIFTYRGGIEYEVPNVLKYTGTFWETYDRFGYTLAAVSSEAKINKHNLYFILAVNLDEPENYKCYIKGNLNEINEENLNEGDCVVIVK